MADRPTWDETWMAFADVMSERSRCVRAQIGAVIVSADNRVISTGYNGPAATYPGEGSCITFCARAQGLSPATGSYHSCPSIHAEANALLYVDRSAVEDGVIFVTGSCCMDCAKLISNSGLSHVVMRVNESDAHRNPDDVIQYLKDCGIAVLVSVDG